MSVELAPDAASPAEVKALLQMTRYLADQVPTVLPRPERVQELLRLVEADLLAELSVADAGRLN